MSLCTAQMLQPQSERSALGGNLAPKTGQTPSARVGLVGDLEDEPRRRAGHQPVELLRRRQRERVGIGGVPGLNVVECPAAVGDEFAHRCRARTHDWKLPAAPDATIPT
jgi:hypothetical protein